MTSSLFDVSWFSSTGVSFAHDLTNLLLLPVLYAEIHYRFRYFFSLLKKKEPEVLADAPYRVDPGKPIPLLILAKDAHLFPCTLSRVHVTVKQGGTLILEKNLLSQPLPLRKRFWWKVFHISPGELIGHQGRLTLDVTLELDKNGTTAVYRNDNYRTSSHRPLEVFVSPHHLPSFRDLYLGDAHTHSDYTHDQVEFGSPLAASVELSKAMGLSFFCVADHSYDLDDRLDDYLTNDPALPKWNRLLRQTKAINARESAFKIVAGEEVSCRSKAGKNVHLLLFGSDRFYPGSGDSAERWFRTRGEHSIEEIANGESGTAFAAHPKETVPFLQRLLLNRAGWKEEDYRKVNISGLQIVNGEYGSGFWEGLDVWISSLLRGRRLFLLAGNDAHGNFNRFRQIGIPFLLIREKRSQIFGEMKTGVFLRGALSQVAILKSFREGRSLVTDGPVARMRARGRRAGEIGSTVNGRDFKLEIEARSTPEFGVLTEVRLLLGVIGERKESVLRRMRKNLGFEFRDTLDVHISNLCYIRMEVRSVGDNSHDRRTHFCLTNPLWLQP